MVFGVLFFIGVVGLCVGSFINVVVRRIHAGEDGIITGASHCPQCGHLLAWYDNVPLVSYLFLRGHCRYCAASIGCQYPIVEAMTGVVYVIVGASLMQSGVWYGSALDVLLLAAVLACVGAMLAVAVYDFLYMEVPMIIVWWACGWACVVVLVRSIMAAEVSLVISHGVAAMGGFLFFFALSYFSQERWMGAGDAYIALVMGMLLGMPGVIVALLLGIWSGAIIGVGMLLIQRAGRGTQIPFGPFLVAGMIGSIVVFAYWGDFVMEMFFGMV